MSFPKAPTYYAERDSPSSIGEQGNSPNGYNLHFYHRQPTHQQNYPRPMLTSGHVFGNDGYPLTKSEPVSSEDYMSYSPQSMTSDCRYAVSGPAPSGPPMSGRESPISSTKSVNESSAGTGPGRRSRHKEERVCGVCGDKALSFNFDAISCESCKAFFRRNASKGVTTFKCPYENKCHMNVSSRRFCKRCRLRKCFEIGMKKEYILTHDEKIRKRMQIEQNKIVRKLEERGWIQRDMLPSELAQRELLSETDLAQLDEIYAAYQASVQMRMEERVGNREGPSMLDLINLAEVSVRRVIEMAKRLNPFKSLPKEDQVALLKGGSIDLLLLRGVISYNPETQQFLEGDDSQTKDSMSITELMKGAGDISGPGFLEFASSILGDLESDQMSLILLLVICLFSEREPQLSDKSRQHVETSQLEYTLLLEKLLKTRFPVAKARRIFPLLINKLADLRELTDQFSKQIIDVNQSCMQPLMSEMLDISKIAAVEQKPSCSTLAIPSPTSTTEECAYQPLCADAAVQECPEVVDTQGPQSHFASQGPQLGHH